MSNKSDLEPNLAHFSSHYDTNYELETQSISSTVANPFVHAATGTNKPIKH